MLVGHVGKTYRSTIVRQPCLSSIMKAQSCNQDITRHQQSFYRASDQHIMYWLFLGLSVQTTFLNVFALRFQRELLSQSDFLFVFKTQFVLKGCGRLVGKCCGLLRTPGLSREKKICPKTIAKYFARVCSQPLKNEKLK